MLGAEAACRIGVTLGRGHYERGFHQTATAGAFGATVAAGRLLGLSAGQMRHALSLVATRASGLKSQFGTMGKPFNAGIAASNGVEAALLASRGMISCADGLGGAQGFIDTHASESFEDRAWAEPLSEKFLFEDNMYKLHACCHGTHAMINALNDGRRQAGLDPDSINAIALRTNPRWLKVCDIKEPRTGLEAKFSYALLAAMTLCGVDTAADTSYTDEICKDPRLLALASRVAVQGDLQVSDTDVRVTVVRSDGGKVELQHDLAVPAKISDLEGGLRRKAIALLGEDRSQMLWSAIAQIDFRNAKDITGSGRVRQGGATISTSLNHTTFWLPSGRSERVLPRSIGRAPRRPRPHCPSICRWDRRDGRFATAAVCLWARRRSAPP